MKAIIRPSVLASAIPAAVLVASFLPSGHAEPETAGEAQRVCSGAFKGKRLGERELAVLLTLSDPQPKDPRLALCGANLEEANLAGADLRWADLYEANLRKANLQKAKLDNADLSFANLSGADLRESSLQFVQLYGANLSDADLSKADASYTWAMNANLERAQLWETNVESSNLMNANLGDAVLFGTNWKDALIFDANLSYAGIGLAKGGNFPDTDSWAQVRGLPFLFLSADVQTMGAFQKLREEFKNSGLREQERALTASIQRSISLNQGPVERTFRWIAFDLTSQYGYAPGRPISILLLGILLFAVPYSIVLMLPDRSRRGAIWMVWNEDRLLDREAGQKVAPRRLGGLGIFKAVRYGLYFSLLSAFHFGWRDLNVGNWIARIQPREYLLRSSGWVRAVSGTQSLISVYLVALWALTYFGRPFE